MLPVISVPREYDSVTMKASRGPLIAGLVAAALLTQACRLPDLREEQANAQPLAQTSFLYAADGALITRLHAGENRVVVGFRRIPEYMGDAVVSIEDKRFYQHRGIDLRALMRAAYVDVTTGRVVEGGSTITQQYVKNTYVGTERTLERKIREAALAWQLEQDLTKDEILGKYLNTVYFGEGAYGIQAATRAFFSKRAADLTLAEAALLAGLISSPADYNPVAHPQRARARRGVVLRAMLDQGMITPREYREADASKLHLRLPERERYRAPYFVDYVKEWFLTNPQFGETQQERYDLLFRGGLRIKTTLDPRLQQYAQTAVKQVLPYERDPYAAMTVLDPRTGAVKAMVGGRDYFSENRFSKLNLATGGSTGRQAGSAFKPFALAAGLQGGVLMPDTVYSAPGSLRIPLKYGQVWDVQNYEGSSSGSLTVENATIRSVNTVYAQMIMDIGPEKVIDMAETMGIRCCERTTEPKADLQALPSAVLGANEVNTLEMASAYGTLATGGYHVPTVPVSRITTADGDVLFQSKPKRKLVANRAVASITNDILQKVVLYGTGTAANISGRPIIGKTGTAQMWRDAWFAGSVPQLTAVVWVGFPQGQVSMTWPRVRIAHVTGGSWPAQIWHAFMVKAIEHKPVRDFRAPKVKFVTVAVDIRRNCLPNRYTPPSIVKRRRYIAGTEPTKKCTEPSSFEQITVPSVIGLSQFRAAQVLRDAGLYTNVITQPSSQTAGIVIAQNPPPNAKAQQSSAVTITVATPLPSPSPMTGTIPSVVGRPEAGAIAAIKNAGFVAAVVKKAACDKSDPGCDYKAGRVWGQSPAGGTTGQLGRTVTIRVNP